MLKVQIDDSRRILLAKRHKISDTALSNNKGRARNRVLPISLREFGHFLGVLLIARLEGKDGSALWQSNSEEEGYRSHLDMS